MHKKFFLYLLVLFFTTNLFGVKNNDIVKIVADKITYENSTVIAQGNVLVFSPSYYITANKIIFDKNSSKLEALENVAIVENNNKKVISNYAFLDLKNDIKDVTPILLIDEKSKIWINAEEFSKEKEMQYLDNGTLSSCDCNDPDWSFGFGSADYNTTSEWINLYNNTLYFGNIPAWYFLIPLAPTLTTENLLMSLLIFKAPYFGFSTNEERRTGLLLPKVSHAKDEGWAYLQPIFYAPSLNYDFEYIPQLRQKRGYGHQLNFRLADSYYSRLEIGGGIFYEKDSYFNKYDLINKKHYGTNIKYDRNKLISNDNHTDGLYLDYNSKNDVEYIKTSYTYNSDDVIDRLQKSEVKYYYDSNNYNFNIGIDRYDDISLENDEEVLQSQPYLQAHKYLDSLFVDSLQYSLDVKVENNTRESGLGAKELEITTPIQYSRYLLNNYLLLGLEKSFVFNGIEYLNNSNNYVNGKLLKTYDRFSLKTNLLKSYNSFSHAITLSTQYSNIKYLHDSGDLHGFNSDSNLSSFTYTKENDNVEFSLEQSFYSNKSFSKILNHKVSQKFDVYNDGSTTYDDLENSILLYLPYTTLSNKIKYNHDEKMIISKLYQLKMKKNHHFLNFDYSHSYDRNTTTGLYEDGKSQESAVTQIGTKVLKYYTMGYKDIYDLDQKVSTLREISVGIDKKCWAIDFKLSDALVATATNTSRAIRQDTIYVTYTLKPLGSFEQKHVQDKRED